MTTNPASTAAFAAAPLPVAPPAPATADALAHAARIILPHLERGQRVDAPTLRGSMVPAFGGSDADGAWDWKTAYDAVRVELTPSQLRVMLDELTGVAGIAQMQAYVNLARVVCANDRAAGTIAALLTQSGIKPTALDYGDDSE